MTGSTAPGAAPTGAPLATPRRRAPTGPIRTANTWNGEPYNVDWERINRWDRQIRKAAREFDVPFERIKAHIVIESQGDERAHQRNPTNGDSYGLMQVVPHGVGWAGWAQDVLRLAGQAAGDVGRMLLDDPALAVRAGAFVLRVQFDAEGDWDRASSKFFLGNADWNGEDHINGTPGFRYRRALEGLIAEITHARARRRGVGPQPD